MIVMGMHGPVGEYMGYQLYITGGLAMELCELLKLPRATDYRGFFLMNLLTV